LSKPFENLITTSETIYSNYTTKIKPTTAQHPWDDWLKKANHPWDDWSKKANHPWDDWLKAGF